VRRRGARNLHRHRFPCTCDFLLSSRQSEPSITGSDTAIAASAKIQGESSDTCANATSQNGAALDLATGYFYSPFRVGGIEKCSQSVLCESGGTGRRTRLRI
jgi:hypothetical protein